MELWHHFVTNQGKSMHKWKNYFPIYERHFSQWKGRSLTFIEIGVDNGGSLEMWRSYFGPHATIIGLDINPDCKKHEQSGINIRIGDQTNTDFLQSVIDEFGIPDIVLDDGGHHSEQIRKSFDFLYPKVSKNGIYMIEDAQMMYDSKFGGSIDNPTSFINLAKNMVDKLSADHEQNPFNPDQFSRSTFSISFYDAVIAFEKRQLHKNDAVRIPNC